jgi:hypothetical protein
LKQIQQLIQTRADVAERQHQQRAAEAEAERERAVIERDERRRVAKEAVLRLQSVCNGVTVDWMIGMYHRTEDVSLLWAAVENEVKQKIDTHKAVLSSLYAEKRNMLVSDLAWDVRHTDVVENLSSRLKRSMLSMASASGACKYAVELLFDSRRLIRALSEKVLALDAAVRSTHRGPKHTDQPMPLRFKRADEAQRRASDRTRIVDGAPADADELESVDSDPLDEENNSEMVAVFESFIPVYNRAIKALEVMVASGLVTHSGFPSGTLFGTDRIVGGADQLNTRIQFDSSEDEAKDERDVGVIAENSEERLLMKKSAESTIKKASRRESRQRTRNGE